MNTTKLRRAIDGAGGVIEVAKYFGISRQAVSLWIRHGVPLGRVPALSKLIKLPPKDIRPDYFIDL